MGPWGPIGHMTLKKILVRLPVRPHIGYATSMRPGLQERSRVPPLDPMGTHINIWMGHAARDLATHPRERELRERRRHRRERKHGDPPIAPARRDEVSRSGTRLTLIFNVCGKLLSVILKTNSCTFLK